VGTQAGAELMGAHMGKEAWRVAAGPAGPGPAGRSYEGLKLGSLSHIQ
jgi:hypothetical protein